MIINQKTGKPYRKDFFRDYAQGKPCLVRIAPEMGLPCAHMDTTVLAHLTMAGLKGTGMKVNDLLGAWACDTCHGLIDQRISAPIEKPRIWVIQAHHEGVARTIDQLKRDGILEYEL